MWQTLLKYLPGIVVNSIGPVMDLIQAKNAKRLKQIKVYCDQVQAGLLTSDQAIPLIEQELK